MQFGARRSDAADLDPAVGEPLVGIVGPQQKPVFGARGEHAVGFRRAAGHKIVDHHAGIGIGAAKGEAARAARSEQGRIDAGDEPLRRRLLIAGGAIDLPGQKQPAASPSAPACASAPADR